MPDEYKELGVPSSSTNALTATPTVLVAPSPRGASALAVTPAELVVTSPSASTLASMPVVDEYYKVIGIIPRAIIAAISGGSTILTGAAGGKNILSYDNGIPWYVNAADTGAGICYAIAVYRGLGVPIKRVTNHRILIYTIAAAGALSASNFYTAGRYGALLLGTPVAIAEALGILNFLARAYHAGRTTVIFCNMFPTWMANFGLICHSDRTKRVRAMQESLRLFITILIAGCTCLFNTDPLFSVPYNIANKWLGIDPNNNKALTVGSYVWAGSMSLAGLPFAHIWLHLAVKKITYALEVDKKLVKPDAYTFAGILLCGLLFLLPVLGSANSPDGAAFTTWVGAKSAFIIKLVVLIIYTCLNPLLGGEWICKRGSELTRKAAFKVTSSFCMGRTQARHDDVAATELPRLPAASTTVVPSYGSSP